MLSGSIKLYDEPKPVQSGYMAYGDYTYDPPANFDAEVEKEVVKALNAGFHIGSKVKRKFGISDQIGVVKHFNKTEKAFNPFTSKIEVLQVEWQASPSYKYDTAYHSDELFLVKEV